MHGISEKFAQNLRGRHDSEDLVEIKNMVWMNWIHLAQNRDQWQALVNTLMKLGIP
jgi:hypothetical protein